MLSSYEADEDSVGAVASSSPGFIVKERQERSATSDQQLSKRPKELTFGERRGVYGEPAKGAESSDSAVARDTAPSDRDILSAWMKEQEMSHALAEMDTTDSMFSSGKRGKDTTRPQSKRKSWSLGNDIVTTSNEERSSSAAGRMNLFYANYIREFRETLDSLKAKDKSSSEQFPAHVSSFPTMAGAETNINIHAKPDVSSKFPPNTPSPFPASNISSGAAHPCPEAARSSEQHDST